MTTINPMIFEALAFLSKQAYEDAKAHGLWDDVNVCRSLRTEDFVRRRCTLLVREEVCEMYEAAKNPVHFAEEMADVVIMCMSAAGHLGIDLAAEVRRKMEINQKRPFRHQAG